MTKADKHTTKSGPPDKLPLCLFAAAIFLTTWLWIKPPLVFFDQGRTICPDIYTPWKNIFLYKPFYPGLPIDWLASLLSYIFYHSTLLAAIILTTMAAAIYTIAKKITNPLNLRNLNILCAIPATLLIIQYARYYHYITEPLSTLLAATAFYYYNKTKLPNNTRLTLFFTTAFLIYIAIPKSLLVFASLSIIAELTKNNIKNAFTLLFLTALSPCLANLLIFKTDLIEIYQTILTFHPNQTPTANIIANISLASWPILLLCSKIIDTYKIKTPKLPKILIPALPAILILFATFSAADYTARARRQVDYYSQNKNWQALLSQAENIPEKDYDMIICHDTNRALYNTGQLPTRMFDYPQHYLSLLLSDQDELTGGILWNTYPKLGTIYYELADINQAQRYASEALELLGYYPIGLKQLALINIIKKQYTTAIVYLNALSKDPIYRNWAKKYLQKINSPQLLMLDKEITEKQNLWICSDQDLAKRYAPHDLFAANNKNKMAFEYMMAFGLLTGQHTPVTNSIKFLDTLNYPQGYIPKLYEQAILLYTQLTGQKADLGSRKISAESIKTFQLFSEEASQAADMTADQAAQALAKDFKNTYYYYYHFLRPKQ